MWHQSAHLGTAGEPTPAAATETFARDLAPGIGDVDHDINRLVCTGDPAGRRVMTRFIADWRQSAKTAHITLTWFPGKAHITGDTATVGGTASSDYWTTATDGSTVNVTQPDVHWVFRLVREDGWRVCGITVPGWSPKPSPSPSPSRTTDPSPTPASPAPSASADEEDDEIPGGAPSDMQKCGPRDPYKDLGWYDCPN